MSDTNPFLEGYKSAVLGRDECPYADGTVEYARWCRGYGGEPAVKRAAPAVRSGCHLSLSAEGRRPFVEGYRSAILATRFGRNTVCPYEDGSPEHERWWKGFRGPVTSGTSKPITIPSLEGRRPFVEGYMSQILAIRFGKKSNCPYEEGSTEYARWTGGFTKGFRAALATKALAELAAP